MAILFDWYENPKTKDKQGEELTLHPRIKLNGSTTTDELRRHIQEYCSLTETDVLAVLDALSHFVGRELGEGRQVHLDGIGYFVPTLTCTEPVIIAGEIMRMPGLPKEPQALHIDIVNGEIEGLS